MAPKYRYFEKELRGFLANVYKIRLQMLNSANLDSLDDEARNAYEWMYGKLERIVNTTQMYLGEYAFAKNDNKDQVWNDLLGEFEEVCPNLFKDDPRRSREENDQAISAKLDDPTKLAVYNASRGLSDLKRSISGMIAKGNYDNYKKQIIEIANDRKAYFAELDTYGRGESFDYTYEELLEKHSAATKKFKDEQSKYTANINEVEKFRKEYFDAMNEASRATGEKDVQIVVLTEEIARNNKRVKDIEERIALLESLRDVDNYKAAEIRENITASRNAIEASEKKAIQLTMEISNLGEQYKDKHDQYRHYDGLMKSIEYPQTGKNYENSPESTKVAKNVLAQYAFLLRVRLNLKRLKAQYVHKLKTLGVSRTAPLELMERFNLGKALAAQMEKESQYSKEGIVTKAVKDGLKGYTVPYQIYTSVKEFTDQLKTVYHASPDMQKAMDENIRNPFDLLHLVDKAINDCNEKTANMYLGIDKNNEFPDLKKFNFTLSDFKKNFDQITDSFARLEASSQDCDNFLAVIEGKQAEKNAVGDEIDRQNQLIKDYNEQLKEQNGENEMEELRKEAKVLVENVKEKAQQLSELQAEVAPYKEKVATLEKTLRELKKQAFSYEDDYRKAKNALESLDAKKHRFMKTRDMHDKLADKANRFMDDNRGLNVGRSCKINKDIWQQNRNALFDQAKEFVRTADFGKDADHTNTPEFNRMIDSIKNVWLGRVGQFALPGDAEAAGLRQTSEELTEKFKKMRAATENYIKEKTKYPHLITFRQREIRMNFAKRLLDFADESMRQLKEMDEMKAALEKDIETSELPEIDIDIDSDATRYDINAAVRNIDATEKSHRPDLDNFLKEKNSEIDQLTDDGFVIVDKADVEQPAEPQLEQPQAPMI